MTEPEEASVLRLVVVFLRFYADRTQVEFGKAARVDQSEISKYEKGTKTPPEESLRRMARAANVGWPVVVHLRRAYRVIQAAAGRRSALSGSPPPSPELLEPALLAVTSYLLADREAARQRSLEEERREADEIWAALERYPILRRRRLIEQAPRASRSRALAARVCAASLRTAPRDAQEALELAELALSIAERVPDEEGTATVELVRRVIEEVEGGRREG